MTAASLEDRLTRILNRALVRFGLRAQLRPYTGLGCVPLSGPGSGWVRLFGRAVLTRRSPRLALRATDRRGWRQFFTAPVFHGEVVATVDGVEHHLTTDRQGYLDVTVPADLPAGWHEVTFAMATGGPPTAGRIRVVGPEPTLGLVSDIDDTVLDTSLPRPLIAAWNTFVRHQHARRAVPGMAALYSRVLAAHPDAPTVYLSTGAWNTWFTLADFLEREGYPPGPLLLTDWGPTQTGWFRSGPEHKRGELRRLAGTLPQVRWLLVGDDGQHDPALYAEFAQQHRDRVAAIALRTLSPAQQVLAHGTPQARRDRGTEGPAADAAVTVRAPDGEGLDRRLHEQAGWIFGTRA